MLTRRGSDRLVISEPQVAMALAAHLRATGTNAWSTGGLGLGLPWIAGC